MLNSCSLELKAEAPKEWALALFEAPRVKINRVDLRVFPLSAILLCRIFFVSTNALGIFFLSVELTSSEISRLLYSLKNVKFVSTILNSILHAFQTYITSNWKDATT